MLISIFPIVKVSIPETVALTTPWLLTWEVLIGERLDGKLLDASQLIIEFLAADVGACSQVDKRFGLFTHYEETFGNKTSCWLRPTSPAEPNRSEQFSFDCNQFAIL